jgi:hypothetical protein
MISSHRQMRSAGKAKNGGKFLLKRGTGWRNPRMGLDRPLLLRARPIGTVREKDFFELAPEEGLEPSTDRLTADCSTIELLWNSKRRVIY